MQTANQPSGEDRASKTTVYFVNGEEQETAEQKLAVKTILSNAGFEPTMEWVLSRDEGGQEFSDQDELVPIHKDERFTATREGPPRRHKSL